MNTFQGLINSYLHHMEPQASWRHYHYLSKQFFGEWIEHPSFMTVYSWHRGQQHIPHHANKGLSFLKAMYTWGIKFGQYIGQNPTLGVPMHGTQSRERAMEKEEIGRLLTACHMGNFSPKSQALLLQLLMTGCRLSEALRMEPKHLDFQTGQWLQPKTKNKRAHITYLPTQVRLALAKLKPGVYFYEGRDVDSMYSVDGAEKAWKRIRETLHLHDVRLHDFRRTWSTHCYRATKDLPLVKRCINHVSKDVTMIYVRFMFDEVSACLQAQADRFDALTRPTIITVPAWQRGASDQPEVRA